jgi:hypothetical protein
MKVQQLGLGSARCGSARPFHELAKEARLGSARHWLASRLDSAREPYSLILIVVLFSELTLYKFEI